MRFQNLKTCLWFSEQFYQLHQSGFGFAEGLILLEKTCTDPQFCLRIQSILRSIKKGRRFSQSLQAHPEYFSETYLALIHVGEQSGRLAEVLRELSLYLKLQINLRHSLIQALIYPSFIFILMIGMLIFFMVFVIPQFAAIFAQFKTPLPLLTQILFALVRKGPYLGVGLGLILLSMTLAYPKYGPLLKQKRILLKIPGLGTYYRNCILMFLFKTLSLSLKSGLSLQQAFHLLPALLQATPFYSLPRLLQHDLNGGSPLEKIFDKPDYFPAICQSYIKIASASGALDHQLSELGQHFEKRIDAQMYRFKIMLEPLILLVMGGIVGGVVLALYQPLFNLGSIL